MTDATESYRSDARWIAARQEWLRDEPGESAAQSFVRRIPAIYEMYLIELAYEQAGSGGVPAVVPTIPAVDGSDPAGGVLRLPSLLPAVLASFPAGRSWSQGQPGSSRPSTSLTAEAPGPATPHSAGPGAVSYSGPAGFVGTAGPGPRAVTS